jgi:uncharacterized protein
MDVTPLIPQGQQIIQSYNANGFKVSGVVHSGAIIVLPEATEIWTAENFSGLSLENFSTLIERSREIDVVLLGTGAKMEFFAPSLKKALKGKGLMVEAMDSGAACRTYNVLMAEGRRVAAALLPLN